MPSLSFPGRAAVTTVAAFRALADPYRADMVALLGDASAGPALSLLTARVRRASRGEFPPSRSSAEQEGEQLEERDPSSRVLERFPPVGLDELLNLPENSVGKVYGRFMASRKFDPADRPQVDPRLVSDPELAWVLQRYRDVHDLWHVLNCMPTTLLGELGQKWFEAVHTGLPVAAFSSIFGPLRLNPEERRVLFRDLVPWAVAAGTSSVNLLAIQYEDYLHRDIDEMRHEWKITSPQTYLREPHILYKGRRGPKKQGPDTASDSANRAEPVSATDDKSASSGNYPSQNER